MDQVKITNLRPDILSDGWYIRFAQLSQSSFDKASWDYTRALLKDAGRINARWVTDYRWDDSKKGAWWVSDFCLRYHADRFVNLSQRMYAARHSQPPSYVPSYVSDALKIFGFTAMPDSDDIKRQYRALSKLYHPDRGGDLDEMKRINDAHEKLLKWLELKQQVDAQWVGRSA